MGFQQTDENQVQCTCGRFYNVGDYCNWCGKTVEKPEEQPVMVSPAVAEGEEVPAPVEAPPQEEQPQEEYPQEEPPQEEPPEEDEEPAAAEAPPPVEQPIATPPPTEGRRSRRER